MSPQAGKTIVDYTALQCGPPISNTTSDAPILRLLTGRRARCWHLWRAQHTHAGLSRWRCRGCCGCEATP